MYAIPLLSVASTLAIVGAPAATADCNYSGGSTLCSSTGTVRGGSAPPPPTFDPYPCSTADPLCAYYDVWDPQIYIDRPDRPDRPNRPGPGGGGRPGRG
ncbi:hypothetical protein BH09ACT8_BH09ACT8_44500 [soil metagenome]